MKTIVPALAAALLLGAGAIAPASAAQDTTPGQTGAQTQTGTQILTNVPNNALTISTYYNEDVYDTQDNKIGTVTDILLDPEGRISAVIVGVGGFLGLGQKDVAVPFNALKVAEKNNDRYLVMNTTKEALESAPGYVYDRSKGVWLPARQPS
ncbi:MAG TPA: PRC-barrel domain-containing protein [Methyloceanibacter sp.]|nr:PRC-barrel domain-containing protein [Methyloceanibacter sp.]